MQLKWPKIFRNETFLPSAFSFFCAVLLSPKVQLTKGYFFSGWNSSETLASCRRSKGSLATELGKSPNSLKNSTFSPMDPAKLSCSLWKQPWPKFLSHDSFSNFVSSCVVCCGVHLQYNVPHVYRLFFCRYLQTEDELPDQENREARGRGCAFLWCHLQQVGTNRQLGQNLPHGNTETAQNI